MNASNNLKQEPKKTTKLRLLSAQREAQAQLGQPRVAIQQVPPYRHITADKHKKHSVDNKKLSKPAKPIKKKKNKNIIQQESINEDERERLQNELQRRADLEKYLKAQQEKMTEEEKQRLKIEEESRRSFEYLWDRDINELKHQQQEIKEWEDYLACKTEPNPRVEMDLNTFVYQILEANQNDVTTLLQKLTQAQYVINLLESAKYQDISQNYYEKQEHYYKYISRLGQIQTSLINKVIELFVKNYETYLLENNQLLKSQYFLPEYTAENLSRILQRIAQKPEERSKYEFHKLSQIEGKAVVGFWYNPISKAGYRLKPVSFEYIHQLIIEIPRPCVSLPLMYKVIWTQWDPFQDYRAYDQYQCVSGVFQIQCLELPKLSKKVNRWALAPAFVDPSQFVKPLKLPPGFQPFSCIFTLSKQYYAKNADQLFIVTHQNGKWTQENTEDLKINLDTRQISFNLKNQLPFMLAQNRFADFPFKDWRLVSIGLGAANLSIITQRNIRVVIQISINDAILIEPIDLIEQCQQFKGRMNLIELLMNLRSVGINLIAQEEDAICLNTQFKLSELENQVLINIMQAIRALSFRGSQWNRQTGADTIIIQYIENIGFNPNIDSDDEYQWKHLEFQLNKVAAIQATDKQYSNQWVNNTLSHANLLLLLEKHTISPPDILHYMDEVSSVEFRAHIRTMLKVMKLVCIN